MPDTIQFHIWYQKAKYPKTYALDVYFKMVILEARLWRIVQKFGLIISCFLQKFLLPQYLEVKRLFGFFENDRIEDRHSKNVLQKLIISGKFRQPIIRTHLDYQKREMQCRFFECIAFRNLEKKVDLRQNFTSKPSFCSDGGGTMQL